MKIKTRKLPYDEVLKLPRLKRKKPLKPSRFLATIVRLVSASTLKKTKFSYTTERMELVGKKPCLILMNHSSFTDMKLAFGIFYPRRMGIVTSVDAMSGFLGKLMRLLGCTPTHKYVPDFSLIQDIKYMLHENKTSVLMYPEAGYSFDGRTTTLPRGLGLLLKRLEVPVVTVITQGAFHRDPLYNMLQIRDIKVSAHVKCIATPEEIAKKSVEELDALIDEAFAFGKEITRYQLMHPSVLTDYIEFFISVRAVIRKIKWRARVFILPATPVVKNGKWTSMVS